MFAKSTLRKSVTGRLSTLRRLVTSICLSVFVGLHGGVAFAQCEGEGDYEGDYSSDYDTDGDYDGGYGGGIQSGVSAASRAKVAMTAGVQQVASGLASFFGETATQPLKIERLSLWEQAALAFYLGDQRRAMMLYHAHLVADGDAATAARNSVQFSRLLKRPVWNVRFGISTYLRAADEFADDPQPIREGLKIAGVMVRGRGMNLGDGSGEDYAMDSSGESDGNYGGEEDMSMDSDLDGGYDRPVEKKVVTTLGGVPTEQATKTLDTNLGLVADVMKTLFSARQAAGKFGPAFVSMEDAGGKLAAAVEDPGFTSASGLPMWIPGVDFVGEGTYNHMLVVAKNNQIDLLLHFDIIVKENRIGPPTYTTRCKLLNVETGETLGVSKAIDKYEIAGKKTSTRESVEEMVVNLFEIIDKKVTVEPMPVLQPQQAVARIDTLLGSSNPGSLRNLAEIMTFRSRDWITPELLDKAFFYAGGEAALQMLHDEEGQRNAIINDFIAREIGSSDGK